MAQALGNEGQIIVGCIDVDGDSPLVNPYLSGDNNKGVKLSGIACSVVCPRRKAKWQALRELSLADQQNHQSSPAKS